MDGKWRNKKKSNKTENLDNYFCSSIGAHWIKRITFQTKMVMKKCISNLMKI